jgi:hypothetical protein
MSTASLVSSVIDAAAVAQGLLIALFSAVVGSILAWFIGNEISYRWDERRRRRESDFAAVQTFYRAYGDFFATWKLWDAHKRFSSTVAPPEVQWRLLERAEEAEGAFETLLVKIVSERRLDDEQREVVGAFRQGYQALREHIRDDRLLAWWSTPSDDPGYDEYRAFKELATRVAVLVGSSPGRRSPRPTAQEAAGNLVAVTASDRHRERWVEQAERLRK